MKVLSRVESFDKYKGVISEIVQFNEGKFKLFVELSNGSSSMKAEKMNSDGIFQHVLGFYDIPYTYTASYVSSDTLKKSDLDAALTAIKKVIKKVY